MYSKYGQPKCKLIGHIVKSVGKWPTVILYTEVDTELIVNVMLLTSYWSQLTHQFIFSQVRLVVACEWNGHNLDVKVLSSFHECWMNCYRGNLTL